MAVTNKSGKGLANAAVPFSPKQRILYFYLFNNTTSFIVLSVLELIPPQRPLSVVKGIISIF